MNEELKCCPFCGRKAKMIQPISGRNRAWNAYCTGGDDPNADCGVVQFGLSGQSKAHVAGLWNRRAEDSLIFAIQSALGTAETGENLVAVARAAHEAEQRLAQVERDAADNAFERDLND